MTTKKRTYNLRLIKATWPYSVEEIAELFGLHKHAVRRWITEGLPANKNGRQFLIRGDALAEFLGRRQQGKKRQCKTHELFCFKCRAQREAYLGIADVVIESPTRLRVKAICSTCDTPMNKVQHTQKLPEIEKAFQIQQLTGRHIIECSNPSVNRDFGERK